MFFLANHQLKQVAIVTDNHEDPINKMFLQKAFGPNYNIEKIKEGVKTMRHSTVTVDTVRADLKRGVNAMTTYRPRPNGTGSSSPAVHFDNNYYMLKTDRQRAGTLIHEASHALLKTKDRLEVTVKDDRTNKDVETKIPGSE